MLRMTAGCAARPERADHVDHGSDSRNQREDHYRHGRSCPPGAQDRPESRLAECREPRGELRIVGGEHALHLIENALLIHGKRHVSPPPPARRGPSGWAFSYYPLLADYLPRPDLSLATPIS